MSAEKVRQEAVALISEARDRAVEYTLNARFRPAMFGDNYVPAATSEEIALQALEGNAMARAYTNAIDILNEVYRRMFQPDDDKKPEPMKKEMY
jgi:hypothetical protein